MAFVLSKIADACEAVVTLLGRVAMVCVFAIIVTVSMNVLVRFFFGVGTVWTQELEWHFLGVVATLGLAYTYQKGEHVRVDIFYKPATPQLKAIIDLLSALAVLWMSVLIFNYTIPYVLQSWNGSEGSADPGGLPMRYLLKGTILVGFLSLILQAIAEIIRKTQFLLIAESEPS